MSKRLSAARINASRGWSGNAVLAALLLCLCGGSGASAQFSRAMPPAEIVGILRDRGFEDITRPRLDGTTYRVEATNRRGERVGLVVDAYDAEILERAFRDRDEAILPPRDVGPRTSRAPSPGRYDPPRMRDVPDDGSRSLDDLDAGEEGRADLDDLPPVPGPVYREALPTPLQELRPQDLSPQELSPQGLGPSRPPVPVDRLGEPARREADRTQPPMRGNPLALPEPAPPTATPPSPGPSSTPARPARTPAAIPPAPAAPPAAAAAAPKPAPPAGEKPEQKNATGVAPAPRSNVRIIGGVTPVIPREAAKPN